MARTIGVTGSTGFVGRHIVRALVERGWKVRALLRDTAKARRVLPAGPVEWVEGDAFNGPALGRFAAGCDAIVHTIGIRREFPPEITFRRMHPGATRRVVETAAAGGVTRFIHISALGTRPEAPTEYHRSKYESEMLVRRSGLEWTILRPSIIHGPDGEFMQMVKAWCLGRAQPFIFIPYFARVERKPGSRLPLPALVSARIQPVSVDDVAQAVVASIENRRAIGEVYPLTGPEVLDWPGLLRAVRDALPLGDKHKRLVAIPAGAAMAAANLANFLGLAALLPFGPSEPVMASEDNTAPLDKVAAHLALTTRPFTSTMREYASRI